MQLKKVYSSTFDHKFSYEQIWHFNIANNW